MVCRTPLLVVLTVLPLVGWIRDSGSVPVNPRAVGVTLDSARAEFDAGRTWHAAQLLEPLFEAGELEPEGVLLLARARAGYRDWPGVVEVLDGASWIDEADGGTGWFLLGRAFEALDRPEHALRSYLAALDRAPGEGVDPQAVVARLARARWASGDSAAALADLDRVTNASLRSWVAEALIGGVAGVGRVARVDDLLARVDDAEVADRLWDVRARALLAAGDTAGAAAEYAAVRVASAPASRRARGWRVAGDLAWSSGDRGGALDAYRRVVADAPTGNGDAVRAAGRLLEASSDLGAAALLDLARHLDRGGDGRRALEAYDRYVAQARAEGGEPDAGARVERARLMSTVPARVEAAIDEWRDLDTHPDPAVGVRTLSLWSALRRSQGRIGDYQTLRRWLVERYPNSEEAASVVFFRADAAHDQERWDDAVATYTQVAEMAPAVDYAGLSRMRAGQIELHRGRSEAAVAIFEAYLRDFPDGRRWEEAAYWAARTRLELGDTEGASALLRRIRAEEPFSYYAVLTADLLGEPYEVDLPAGSAPAPPDWVAPGLRTVDLLVAAGLMDAATNVAEGLGDRARSEGVEALMAVAEGLNVRGRTLSGINLGWAARAEGAEWTDRLVRIVYPFPYQELVLREAREVGVDPLLLAALIRQESAFVPDIRSSAGAVGLMQVMPATGRDLARDHGVANFTTETLESPEVNLHLGARFLVDQLGRYGPELPLVLSAYNAGPARANAWRTLPEAGDLLRLTERIPFSETRGYVKNVTRNRRLYEALYGASLDATGR